jgi:hypothetical protein
MSGEWPEKVWLRKDFSRGTWSAQDFDPSDPVKALVPGLGANHTSGPYIPAERLDEEQARLETVLKEAKRLCHEIEDGPPRLQAAREKAEASFDAVLDELLKLELAAIRAKGSEG